MILFNYIDVAFANILFFIISIIRIMLNSIKYRINKSFNNSLQQPCWG